MASKIIPTITNSIVNGNDFQIHTYYVGTSYICCGEENYTELPNIQIANYYQEEGNLNGVSFLNGELIVSGQNLPLSNDIYINNNGELIVNGLDANAYYIDENGDLIYDFCSAENSQEYYQCGYVENGYVNQ